MFPERTSTLFPNPSAFDPRATIALFGEASGALDRSKSKLASCGSLETPNGSRFSFVGHLEFRPAQLFGGCDGGQSL
jgi:hypothetical protein